MFDDWESVGGGPEEDWWRVGGGLEDWRRVGGGLEKDRRSIGEVLEEDVSIEFR